MDDEKDEEKVPSAPSGIYFHNRPLPQLFAASSGLNANMGSSNSPIRTEPSEEAHKNRAKALDALESSKFNQAIAIYKRAYSINEDNDNKYEMAVDSISIAECYQSKLNQPLDAMTHDRDSSLLEYHYKKALELFKEVNSRYGQINVYRKLADFYESKADVKSALDCRAKLYDLEQGPIDIDARRVEQHEVGFSNSFKLGTDNIQQCMVVIVRDSNTNLTALSHFDSQTKPESLETEVIATFGPDAKLELRLIGGFLNNPQIVADALNNQNMSFDQQIAQIQKAIQGMNAIVDEKQHEKNSAKNILNVLNVLSNSKNQNLILVSANIGDQKNITAITFDPINDVLENSVPSYEYSDRWIRDGYLGFDILISSPLRVAFIENEERKPLLLNKEQLTFACTTYNQCKYVEDDTENNIFSAITVKYPRLSKEWRAKLAKGTIEVIKEIEKQKNALETKLEMEVDITKIEYLYIGEDAEKENLALVRAKALFVDQNIGQMASQKLQELDDAQSLADSFFASSPQQQRQPSAIRHTLEGSQVGTPSYRLGTSSSSKFPHR